MEKSESVGNAAKKVVGVTGVYPTNGIYDLILRAEEEDESRLGQVIRKIKRIVGVTATLTTIVYNPSNTGNSSVVVNQPYIMPIKYDGD